jgi:nucleoside-diphosphate-sugar epimerase
MLITGVRPANLTAPDKLRGSVDHVNCVTQPARGRPVSFPYRDAMRIPVHVDDIAEVFARVAMADKPKHAIYNSGGHTISMGALADMVREFVPDAEIKFEHDTGGPFRATLIDNSRLVQLGVQYAPFRQRVREIINDIRKEEGRSPLSDALDPLRAGRQHSP